MDKNNVATNTFFTEQADRKNKRYEKMKISILSYDVVDVICTSEYDVTTKEWYGDDEDWGVN